MCGLKISRWAPAFIAALILATPVQAGFRVTDLGRNVTPAAINNNGEVAGYLTLADGHKEAFLYSNRSLQRLGFFGGTDSEAKALNDKGGVVGNFTANGDTHGFYLDNGQFTDLFSAAEMVTAVDINNQGAILGEVPSGYWWSDAALYDHGLLTKYQFASFIRLRAIALNELGQTLLFQHVCADVDCAISYRVGSEAVASRYWFTATAMNDKGLMAGWFIGGPDLEPFPRGYHWDTYTSDGSNLIHITDLGGRCTYPSSINNLGQIVGKAQRRLEDTFRPFIYSNGRMIDLNTLTPNKIGWTLLEANAINERGQIIGIGTLYGKQHGFLLTPSLQPVQIEIKSYEAGDVTTLRTEQRVTVTFFGSSVFDAATVRPASIKMSGAEMGLKGRGDRYLYQIEDLNNDGFMDFVSTVKIQKVSAPPASPSQLLTVEAVTSAGKGIYGEQELQLTPPVK